MIASSIVILIAAVTYAGLAVFHAFVIFANLVGYDFQSLEGGIVKRFARGSAEFAASNDRDIMMAAIAAVLLAVMWPLVYAYAAGREAASEKSQLKKSN